MRKSTCPICDRPTEAEFRPFCSKRCADVDLGRWLNESYVVPGAADEEEDEMPESEPKLH